ncbi:hypothetical protein HBZC1_16760 [Helicobacter bizzozeronii CIII-1]|uniref:Uncharacterized protein n=1 Tax=Helicobacter bizzozeronii (strain CIII-1) TaxID=1002804 RepID=F8KPD9_HELBC|nr:hypothetical protein HBZC1_16760 [Helicobacter bizzozeronii CIII-1]
METKELPLEPQKDLDRMPPSKTRHLPAPSGQSPHPFKEMALKPPKFALDKH